MLFLSLIALAVSPKLYGKLGDWFLKEGNSFLKLVGSSCGQYEYPNYGETGAQDNPPAYANPDYQNNPQPTQPQYPDYSEVETVETTTSTTTPRPTRRPQVFPPTPTRRRATRRQQPNRIVRWYIMNSQGVPIQTAVSRRYTTGSLYNGLPAYYRSIISGSRSMGSTAGNGMHTKRVVYWWNM